VTVVAPAGLPVAATAVREQTGAGTEACPGRRERPQAGLCTYLLGKNKVSGPAMGRKRLGKGVICKIFAN